MQHEHGLKFRRPGRASGPFHFMNPTVRRLEIEGGKESAAQPTSSSTKSPQTATAESMRPGEEPASQVQWEWRSRDNRKGRHALSVKRQQEAKFLTPASTSTIRATLNGIWRMFTVVPYWDVSYLVAVIFTIGSIVWVINGFFAWLPLAAPSTEFPGEMSDGGGITAFIGATIFEIGSVLLMVEAVNESRSDCFGWAVEEALEEHGLWRVQPALDTCHHHHRNKKNLVGKGQKSDIHAPAQPWTWWPTWDEFFGHYIREVGFLACMSQMFGATIFWISGFTALPGILDRLTTAPAIDGAYWSPQVIGGCGFIVSSTFFMLETQRKWYIPAPKVLGWHIGFWNLIGAIGFTLCGALGYSSSDSGVAYQASLSTFWGSWAFLIGSIIQWYESLDKHPVEEEGGG